MYQLSGLHYPKSVLGIRRDVDQHSMQGRLASDSDGRMAI